MKRLFCLLALLAGSAGSLAAQNFAIDWHVIAPGGGRAAGGGFELNGTVGQPAAGAADGRGFEISGGFWPGAVLEGGTCSLTITQQPVSVTAYAGQTVSFQVGATGTPPPGSFQWQEDRGDNFGFRDIPAATNATYFLRALRDDGYLAWLAFRCRVGNGCTNVFSDSARLTVLPCDLVITRQPAHLAVFPGQTATFAIEATGTPAELTYQWQAGPGSEPFTNLPPATGPTLTLTASLMNNGTQFRCVVGNDCTTVVSDAATLTVVPPPPAHDFAALGLSLTPLAAGLYEAAPQVEVSIGAGAISQVPLDFLLTVNGELRFDGRGAEMIGLPPELVTPCPDSECLNKLCYVATRSGRKEGTCSSDCLCTATVTLAAVPLALSPGDVVQLILDPDHRVPELHEGNNTFTLTLPNHPPVLARIPNQAVHAGTLIQFTPPAHDEDARQTLSFALEGGPDGAAIDPATGEFRWQTTAAHIGTSNLVVVRVSDNGQPALSAFQDFIISVAPPPVIVANALTSDCWQLTWTAVPGNTYRIEATSDLSSGEWVEQVGNLSAQDTVASWCLPIPAAHAHLYFRIAVVAALDAPVLTTAAAAVTNQPAWTCCERNIQFPKTVKIEAGATTGLTNNNTRRFVTVDLTLPLEYNCANVPDQKCLADLAAKVVFRPRQDDGTGQHTQDPEEEMLITIVKTPEEAPDCVPVGKPHTMKLTIRWRGTYRATRHVKGTLNLELSVPGAKGDVNHKLDVDVESGRTQKASNPVLKKVE